MHLNIFEVFLIMWENAEYLILREKWIWGYMVYIVWSHIQGCGDKSIYNYRSIYKYMDIWERRVYKNIII